MPVAYDENVILSFADSLYRRAASLVFGHTVLGALAGAFLGLVGGGASQIPNLLILGTLSLTLVGAIIGASIGRARAFALRLAAQTALCQVRIERNTRHVTDLPPPFGVGNAGSFPAQRY